MATNEEEKNALSPRQCTMSQVKHNNGKTTRISLRIASTTTLFTRTGPQWLLAVCRPQKNAPGKEIWLQWRNGYWKLRHILRPKTNCSTKKILNC